MGRPAIQRSLTTEDQAEHEPDAKRGKDRLGWIFAHVLFGILLETADAIARLIPSLFRFAAILTGHGASRRAKILRRFPCVRSAALHFLLGLRRGRGVFCRFLFVSHIFFLIEPRSFAG